ncbi:MAG: tRNA epoxyqueuosine(34) reductase QueG [Muribaculum sp.]|nr:tRNA epoxyqueuosine(34) reductase QueG [Muribaculaceae bacterium]MCM1081663.1 tRNA epoxyqueuosine(34) reductase QueG [Muribaculum sp.]
MSSSLSNNSDTVRLAALTQGASRVGIAETHIVPDVIINSYRRWISEGKHASMSYLERYDYIRRNPSLLLQGAKSIIVCAFNYYPAVKRAASLPYIAYYAYGRDYHDVLRQRLQPVVSEIEHLFPGEKCRICIDTAPLLERYWAVQAGVGFIGRHSQLIVPGIGSYVLLASIITTATLLPDPPCYMSCPDACRRCIDACPGKAICSDFHIDANRCLSYLTIEHRGPFPTGTNTYAHLYGCDSCQMACPFNNDATPTAIAEFTPSESLFNLTATEVANLTQQQFSSLFAHSPIKRAKLAGLVRNALNANQ